MNSRVNRGSNYDMAGHNLRRYVVDYNIEYGIPQMAGTSGSPSVRGPQAPGPRVHCVYHSVMLWVTELLVVVGFYYP